MHDVEETYPEIPDEKKPNDLDLDTLVLGNKQIATVAWMIVIGDGLHNFIDGLAIGASCSTSVLSGLSTSLAICCEELPHELGDFAILLKSGMTFKQAILANFGSACLCYLGLIIGLILGFKTSAVRYIYGIAGGMFLYISLVDMLPESIQMVLDLTGKSKKKGFKMLLVQNLFILLGMSAMLLLSFYAPKVKKAKW
ncbi:zinc transporter ZIP14-like isoform X1 [Paramuricea clavata]|uniref:Zinc transporter ZIP14-like isoform X1 n=1 Tax=Paramuricea clavata TaxID=317549 RepID=A0A6S7IR52_PARCT|nr:zinc transporter ZIP14-like isoform X1 [Paramuricea clavata]